MHSLLLLPPVFTLLAAGSAAADQVEDAIILGVYGPFTSITQDDLATAVLFDLDFRKNLEPAVRRRFGDPIISIPNRHPDLDVRVQLGTSDSQKTVGVETSLDWFLGRNGYEKVAGIVGGYFSSIAMAVASMSEVFNVPQIAFGATNTFLSDKSAYPMFSRTIPPDSVQGAAMWAWMNQFEIPSATFFYRRREAYGEGLLQTALDHANSAGQSSRISGIGVDLIDEDAADLAQLTASLPRLRRAGSKFIVIVISDPAEITLAMYALEQQGMLYDNYQILGPDAFSILLHKTYRPSRGYPVGAQKFTPVTRGELHSKFVEMWRLMTPDDVYGLNATERYRMSGLGVPLSAASTAALSLSDFQQSSPWFFSHFLFDAAYTFLIAANSLLNSGLNVSEIVGQTLLDEIRRTQFEGITGYVTFDENADRIGDFELWNVLEDNGEPQSVATWSSLTGNFSFTGARTALTWAMGTVSAHAPAALVACAPGQRWDEFAQLCIFCPVNHFSPGGVFSEARCIACEAGRASTLPLGADDCMDCSPGTFRDSNGDMCAPCPVGTFNAQSGQSACEECPVGRFAAEEGSESCEQCQFGTTLLLGARDASFCQCGPGTFDYESAAGERWCQPCTEFMEPCMGGDDKPRQRKSYFVTVDGQHVYRCASEEACPGGPLGVCPTGASGPGCASCALGSYFWDGDRCVKCTSTISALVASVPVLCILGCLVVHHFGNDPLGKSLSNSAEFLVLVGLTLNIFIYMSAFHTIDIDWKEPMLSVVGLTSLVSSAGAISMPLACSLRLRAVSQFALTSVLPFCLVAFCALLAVVKAATPRKLFNTLGNIAYALFLLLVLHALKPFRFIVHPSGEKSVLAMPEITEGTEDHLALVVIGLLAVLLLCVPFLSACTWASWAVAHSRRDSTKIFYLQSFRFLFFKFRPEAFYWGVCALVRNTTIAAAPSLWPKHPVIAVFVIASLVVLSATHTGMIFPWRRGWMNWVDMSILCYMSLVLHLAAGWLQDESNAGDYLATGLASVALVAIFIFFLQIIRLFMKIILLGEEGRELRRQKLRNLEEMDNQSSLDFFRSSDALEVCDVFESLVHEDDVNYSKAQAQHKPWIDWITKQECNVEVVRSILQQLREDNYNAAQFIADCLAAFPELQLYGYSGQSDNPNGSRKNVVLANGVTSAEEQQRTFGALLAIYWICRLDMDGKQGMAFGVDEDNNCAVREPPEVDSPVTEAPPWSKMDRSQRQVHFFSDFDWQLFIKLFEEAGILSVQDGRIELDTSLDGRLMAMLSLTAYHDIMKDPQLCPTVRGDAYEGFSPGEEIFDHDLALAYVLDRSPFLLPSYAIMTAEQQKSVRFTQSEMGFNAGWLVQAEGPPSAVLSKLKKATQKGAASRRDVAFYFVHWVTDLAGAEPTPYRGSEKFAVKFPPKVLQSLLSCFNIVDGLALHTETEVYEAYLEFRWQEHEGATNASSSTTASYDASVEKAGASPSSRTTSSSSLDRTARLRLHCMAQHNSETLVAAFDSIPAEDQQTLSRELAESGLPGQHFSEWQPLGGPAVGTPFLLYYGPAWCQRAGQSHPELCLRVLAQVFRAARKAFPESVENFEKEQSEGVLSRTIQVGLLKTMDLDLLDQLLLQKKSQCFLVFAKNRLEGELDICNVMDV